MSCCKYSSEYVNTSKTAIENIFISDFMLDAPEKCVKVYLYGLYKCNNPESLDNNIASFAKVLNYSEEDVISAFMYWEDLNLVQIITKDPFEVRYLPVKNGTSALKKFNIDKYKSFNIKAQEILENRMITPAEYQEYYYLIESKHIEPDALIMIIKYCVSVKSANISSSYILTVAKNWIFDGVLTCEAVEERMKELERSSEDVKEVLKALGTRRKATEEEYALYLEWKNKYQTTQEVIVHLARKAKEKGAGIKRLDALVQKCYNMRLDSVKEIDDFFNNMDNMYELAKRTCKAMGLRYDDIEIVVDNYIAPWLKLGFDADAIINVASYCFKFSIRTLEGLNGKLNQMYHLGLLTNENIVEYINDLAKNDGKISDILKSFGMDRNVSTFDRQMYNTWVDTWQINEELIKLAVDKSIGMSMPMQYLNKLLSTFYSKKITTKEEAEKYLNEKSSYQKDRSTPGAEKAKGLEYSKDQLNSMIDNIFEVEI